MQSIRIGSGQGYWGDWLEGPKLQVRKGEIDFLVMDYLAEVTMSIMQKQRQKNPARGYAADFVDFIRETLPDLLEKKITVITNAGGVNPHACQAAVLQVARQLGYSDLRVGIVAGDDILGQIDTLLDAGHSLTHMENGEELETVRQRIYSANVYFGAEGIVSCLEQGAQIIVTGRCTDTSLTLAPMAFHYGWDFNDWDKMASGIVAGHILECGAQASGGNFLGGWTPAMDLVELGYPIVEAAADGTFVVTKTPATAGIVNQAVVKEQLLYELGDPENYIAPEVVVDFTSIRLSDDGENRVRVSGIAGRPATDSYKVSIAYADGWKAIGQMTYAWPDALAKARAADTLIRGRLDWLGLHFEEIHSEFLGYNACHGPLVSAGQDPDEVVLLVGVKGAERAAVERFGREIVPLVLTGPPTVTGFGGGRPKASEVVAYWPALLAKHAVSPNISVHKAGDIN